MSSTYDRAIQEANKRNQLKEITNTISVFEHILQKLVDSKEDVEQDLENIGKNMLTVKIDLNSLSHVQLIQLLAMVEYDPAIAKIQALIHTVKP